MCIPTIYRSRQQESLPDIRKQFQMQTIQNIYSPYRNMCITTSGLTSWFYSNVQKHSPVFSVILDWIFHTHICGAKKGGVGVGVTLIGNKQHNWLCSFSIMSSKQQIFSKGEYVMSAPWITVAHSRTGKGFEYLLRQTRMTGADFTFMPTEILIFISFSNRN